MPKSAKKAIKREKQTFFRGGSGRFCVILQRMKVNNMNREILGIALPAIVANVTIPLLGLVDTAIAGHLGDERMIGAVAVGTMMFNLVYWNFGFLRMGTSGLTAQAYGRGATLDQVAVLRQSCRIALLVSVAILLLQYPLQALTLWIIGPSAMVARLARTYFYITVWGAPPVLLMMSIKGWLLGMQDARGAMMVSVLVNVFNIVASLLAAVVLGMGFVGIAVGTVVGEYLGLAYALWLLHRRYGDQLRRAVSSEPLPSTENRRFFAVSSDIFVRSFLLMTVMLAFMAIGARSGDLVLAVNALMMQLFTLYSYFMDGIAFAGEAVVGKYVGRNDVAAERRCVRWLMVWAVGITIVFTVAYAFPHWLFALLTDAPAVIAAAMDYRWWCAAIPVAGMLAFVWDGVFIGLARTRPLLLAVAVATAAFYLLWWLLPNGWGNNRLWTAYLTFLVLRGAVLSVIYWIRCQRVRP